MKTKYQRILDLQFQSTDSNIFKYNHSHHNYINHFGDTNKQGFTLSELKQNNYDLQKNNSSYHNTKKQIKYNHIHQQTNLANLKYQIYNQSKSIQNKNKKQIKETKEYKQSKDNRQNRENKENIYKTDSFKRTGQSIRKKYNHSLTSSKSTSNLNHKKFQSKTKNIVDTRIINIDALNDKIYKILQEKTNNQNSKQYLHFNNNNNDESLQIQKKNNFSLLKNRSQSHQKLHIKHNAQDKWNKYQLRSYSKSKELNVQTPKLFQAQNNNINGVFKIQRNDEKYSGDNQKNLKNSEKQKLNSKNIQKNNSFGLEEQLIVKQNQGFEFIETPKTIIQYSNRQNDLQIKLPSDRYFQIETKRINFNQTFKPQNNQTNVHDNYHNNSYDSNVHEWSKYDQQIQQMESKIKKYDQWKKQNHVFDQSFQNCHHLNQNSLSTNFINSKENSSTNKLNKNQNENNQRNQWKIKQFKPNANFQRSNKDKYSLLYQQDQQLLIKRRQSTLQTEFRLQFNEGIQIQDKKQKSTTQRLVACLINQRKLDKQFIQYKKWFKQIQQDKKWQILLRKLRDRQQEFPQMDQDQIYQKFDVNDEQLDPFFTLTNKDNIFNIQGVVDKFIKCQRHWNSKIYHRFSECELNNSQFMKSLDDQLQLKDLVRVLNRYNNERQYFKCRQLYLIQKRLNGSKSDLVLSKNKIKSILKR